jgi:hypothetical protein
MTLRANIDQLTLAIDDTEDPKNLEILVGPVFEHVPAEITAYRGDSSLIDRFEVAKMRVDGLFGHGIYLTNNATVAEDYAFASESSCQHVFQNCTDERDAIRAYMKSLILNECGYQDKMSQLRNSISQRVYDHTEQGDLDFDVHHDNLRKEYEKGLSTLAADTMADAKRLLAERRETVRFHTDTLGNYRMLADEAKGFVTSFSLPTAFTSLMLDADVPLSDEALKAVGDTFKALGYHSFRHEQTFLDTWEEWVDLVRQKPMGYAWRDNHEFGGTGLNPSLDDIRNGTYFGISAFHDLDAQKILAEKLEDVGYRGITFQGGTPGSGELPRGGGGVLHRVFVVWNDDYLHTRRLGSTEIATSPILAAHEKHMRVATFNL